MSSIKKELDLLRGRIVGAIENPDDLNPEELQHVVEDVDAHFDAEIRLLAERQHVSQPLVRKP